MSEQSYEFTGVEKVNACGVTVKQIRAVRDIPRHGVRNGDVGGWIESAELKSGNARVSGNAWVFGDAQVFGDARVFGDAWVSGNARVSGNAEVSGNARVFGDAWVFGDARVFGGARVFGDAWVSGNARVSGDARVFGDAWVSGNAEVSRRNHFICIGPIGSENVIATIARGKNGKHILTVGCWTGTLGTLMAEVKRRRDFWSGDEAQHDVWTAQYRTLKALGKATVKQWGEA